MTRTHGWCTKGAALINKVPHGHWKMLTFIAGLRHNGIVAPWVLDGQQRIECDAVDEWPSAHDIVALPRHQGQAQQIAQGIGQRHDLGGQPAFRASDGLILSPILAPGAFW